MRRKKHSDGPWLVHGQAIVTKNFDQRFYKPQEVEAYGGTLVCEKEKIYE